MTPRTSKTPKNIGVAFISFGGTPKYKNMFESSFVMLNEWFKSTVSEPVKFVAIKPFKRFGYIKNIITFNAKGNAIPIILKTLLLKSSVIFFFS
jgi:hypothetical protein